MIKTKLYIFIICIIFLLTALLFTPVEKRYRVTDVISPLEINLGSEIYRIKDYDCFDCQFTEKNKKLSEILNISEDEAFILGNLGKDWASGLLKNRLAFKDKNSHLIYLKFSYNDKFMYSGFCLKDNQPCCPKKFEKRLNEIRHTKYTILDLDTDIAHEINSQEAHRLKRFIVIKKFHLPRNSLKTKLPEQNLFMPPVVDTGKVQVYFTDFTTKLKADRNCETSMCKEILRNINDAKTSIDIAIYGYSRTPDIEKALTSAIKRGVKVRLICDSDSAGKNIYPDTDLIRKLLTNNMTDINSAEANSIMHNKFYIFDDKILITGSANLSHTDMSGFNSNSMVVIESDKVAGIYKQEFDAMFSGKFHNDKSFIPNKNLKLGESDISIYFSPKDKSISNALLPLIRGAKQYIYIPSFLLTDKKITSELISAKQRGVDVRIIIDALNASVQHSKHKELRNGGVQVKTENYAGKMHSKSMIIDDKYTVIGSMNFSYSGENKNDENLIVIKNEELAKSYKNFFLYQWSKIDDKWLKYNARAEGKDSLGSCSDGIDNNYDGLTDMEDPACR